MELLKNANMEQNRLSSKTYSNRPWPIKCGQNRIDSFDSKTTSLLITGFGQFEQIITNHFLDMRMARFIFGGLIE